MNFQTPSLLAPEPGSSRVLIVDDEIELTHALTEMLTRQGYEANGFTSGNQALDALRSQSFDILLADLMMPEMDGISLLKSALAIDPNLVGIIMTGQGTVQTAVEAMKSGAFDYIMKPFKFSAILGVLTRSLEVRHLRMENVQLHELLNFYELGQVTAATLDIDAILHKTAEAALQQCQAEEVSILLATEEGEGLYLAHISSPEIKKQERLGQRVPLDGTITGWVAKHPATLILEGAVKDERFKPLQPRPEIHTAICVPMLAGKKLVGIINVNRIEYHRPLTQGQVKGLNLLTGMAASAIENAHLYEQTEQRLRRLMALRTIDLAITSSLDIRVTLDIVLEQVITQLAADAAAIRLLDPQTQYLDYAAGRGFHTSRLANVRILLGEGYSGRAALNHKTVLIPDLAAAGSDPTQEILTAEEAIQSSYIAPLISKAEIEGVIEVFYRSPFTPDAEWISFLEALAGQAAIAIDSARLYDNLQFTNQQLILAYNATIEGWSRALDLRDKETEGHTQRVTEMTLKLARFLNIFNDEELVQIRRGALLHDIGKMGVPDQILLKENKLTDEEEQVMRKHPEYAYQLLSPILYLRNALDIPRYHHERWDGSGYPLGLKGEQIPIAARMFSIVDVWDALRSDRPYRAGWPEEKVLGYIEDMAGKQFDPQLVEAFLKVNGEKGTA